MSATEFSYCIDEHDRLVQASSGYFRFAEENRWPGARDSIGESLWDFVSGTTMRTVQRSLLGRIRERGDSIELPFRCDGPQARREMKIEITALATDRISFTAQVIAERSRGYQPLLNPDVPRGTDLLEMCGWCDRFAVAGEWMEIEEAVTKLGLTNTSTPPAISHGICESCSNMLLAA